MGLKWECDVEKSCSKWALAYFADCVCDFADLASFVLGLSSILCWGIAEIPQIFSNWNAASTETVSLAFILTWMIGDIFNLLGCWINPATLPTQFYIAVLYTATTAILVGQQLWFAWRVQLAVPLSPSAPSVLERPAAVSSPIKRNSLEGLFPSSSSSADVPRGQTKRGGRPPLPVPSSAPIRAQQRSPGSYTGSWRRMTLSSSVGTFGSTPKLKGLVFSSLVIVGVHLGGSTLFQGKQTATYSSRRQLGQVGSSTEDVAQSVGWILGWLMTCIYLTGRLPQVILNWTGEFIIGVSITQVAFAFIGNAMYLGSILVRYTGWTRLRLNLPWVVDITCCLLMDIFIMFQYFIFQTKAEREAQYTALE